MTHPETHQDEGRQTVLGSRTVGRRKARVAGVGLAVVAALTVWLIATAVVGIDLWAPDFNGQDQEMAIGPLLVIIMSGGASLLGWGSLAALERLTDRAPAIWAAGAVVLLIASLGGPFGGTGITAGNRISLALMHVVTAAVIIPIFYRSSDVRRA